MGASHQGVESTITLEAFFLKKAGRIEKGEIHSLIQVPLTYSFVIWHLGVLVQCVCLCLPVCRAAFGCEIEEKRKVEVTL